MSPNRCLGSSATKWPTSAAEPIQHAMRATTCCKWPKKVHVLQKTNMSPAKAVGRSCFLFPRSCYTSAVDGAVLMSFFCKSSAHVAEGCETT